MAAKTTGTSKASALYTEKQRARRDASRWTLVQGILAPLQFLVFAISVFLVWRFLSTGAGAEAAMMSVVLKTFVLYAIMVTGALWEHDVYGKYLFADAFFWEDFVSMFVIALHTAYLLVVAFGVLTTEQQFWLALLAYGAYVINAAQFLIKFRMARKQISTPNGLAGATG